MQLHKIPGFESTAYAYQNGRVVWVGANPATDHPRNAWQPWHPATCSLELDRLQTGASICLSMLDSLSPLRLEVKGLLLWLTNQTLPFPLNLATQRFEAIRAAMHRRDLTALEAAALRVLGLGHGLTPSGDDFVGGLLFALTFRQRFSSGETWLDGLPQTACRISEKARLATNVISAALLDDLLAGQSYRVLHELLGALNTQDTDTIRAAASRLLTLGASSGADLLAGVLLGLGPRADRH